MKKISEKCFLSLALLQPLLGQGYSVQTHVEITKQAFLDYNHCASELGKSPIPESLLPKFVNGNIAEDRNLALKAFHWHFYHPTKELGAASLGLGNASFKGRFLKSEAKLARSGAPKVLGGLLHFIQDVTNPAHVTPIFHSVSDSFDNFPFGPLLKRKLSIADCEQIFSRAQSAESFWSHIEEQTRRTLESIEESFSYQESGRTHLIRWSEAFWSPEYGKGSLRRSFGHYGLFGNLFGVSRIDSKEILPEEYGRYAQQQIRAASDWTMIFFEKWRQSFPKRAIQHLGSPF